MTSMFYNENIFRSFSKESKETRARDTATRVAPPPRRPPPRRPSPRRPAPASPRPLRLPGECACSVLVFRPCDKPRPHPFCSMAAPRGFGRTWERLGTWASETPACEPRCLPCLLLHPLSPPRGPCGPLPLRTHEAQARFPQDREHLPGKRGSSGRAGGPFRLCRDTGWQRGSCGCRVSARVRLSCLEILSKVVNCPGVVNMERGSNQVWSLIRFCLWFVRSGAFWEFPSV
jgi:hypothetical protein